MVVADQYAKSKRYGYKNLSPKQQEFQYCKAFTRIELNKDTHRLALMNTLLHEIADEILAQLDLATKEMQELARLLGEGD